MGRTLPPRYSSDIATAWRLVAKYIAYNPVTQRSDDRTSFELKGTAYGFTCTFTKGNEWDLSAEGKTEAHAIALAAKRVAQFVGKK